MCTCKQNPFSTITCNAATDSGKKMRMVWVAGAYLLSREETKKGLIVVYINSLGVMWC